MTNQRGPLTPVACLTLAGLLSSLLTVYLPRLAFGFLGIFGVGMTFGVMLAACFRLIFRVRSPWRLGGFVITSATAFPLAVYSSFVGELFAINFRRLLGLGLGPRGQIDPISLFVPGALGAFLVLAAGLFAISSQKQRSWRILLKSFLWSILGGVLGAVGYAMGSSLGPVLLQATRTPGRPIPAETAHDYSMFVAWQTGVALLMGLLWWHGETALAAGAGEVSEAESVPAASERIPLVAKLFFISAAFLFLYLAGRQLWASYERTRAQREIERSIAEAPSSENLPPVQPMSLSQALILSPIAGYVVRSTDTLYIPAAKASPSGPVASASRAYYHADYVQQGSGGVTAAGPPEIIVSLTQYPNSAWASYQLRNTPVPNAAYIYANDRKKVMKFGNSVLQDSGGVKTTGESSFCWPSGKVLVVVSFRKGERDELLHAYLEKYPSGLRP